MKRHESLAVTLWVSIASLFVISPAVGQNVLFESNLSPTGLGSAPTIGGVPADDFAWDLSSAEVVIDADGDLSLKAEDLLILDTGGADPGAEGTNGGRDFFASLVCGNQLAGSSAAVTPTPDGKVEIQELDFLTSIGVADCPGAIILLQSDAGGEEEMFGAAGGGFNNPHRIYLVDQTDASVLPVGDLALTVNGLAGLAFDSNQRLFGARNSPPCCGGARELIEIDPDTGVETLIGPLGTRIRDLAVQPGTDILFGTAGSPVFTNGTLVTIDKGNASLTVVFDFGGGAAGLAFAPDGTLYRTGFSSSVCSGVSGPTLETLDLGTGTVSDCVTLDLFMDGLAVRPSDGTIFATRGASREIYTIDPATGALTFVGLATGPPFGDGGPLLSDLAFRIASPPWVAASGF